MKIDKQNGTVAFNDQEHIYWNVNDNKRYVSVTTLIHRYTQEFDKEFWSSYKALEKLLPKKSWEIEKKSLLNTKKFIKELLILYDIDENDFNEVQQDILAGQVDLIIKSGNEITIVDHKTNKKIDQKSGFNTTTKSNTKMKYPLNNLMDCNFYHYTLQLSTYAWMLQKINPNFVIKDLILNHYDHNGNNTLYHCEYLKHDVEKMLYHYKKSLILE